MKRYLEFTLSPNPLVNNKRSKNEKQEEINELRNGRKDSRASRDVQSKPRFVGIASSDLLLLM